MEVELKPHQSKAVEELTNGNVLAGGTGVGKSITAMAYFVSKVCGGVYGDFGSMRTPMDVYVITTAKKRDTKDWEGEAIKFGISTLREASPGGIKLTVDSWNNLGRYYDVENAFFIFDEQRVVGNGTWVKSFIHIAKQNQWILLSATPGDTWLDYIPVFLANGFYKNRTAFIREHVIYEPYVKFPKVQRYVNPGKLVRLRNKILVEMPYERHTTRYQKIIPCDYDETLFERVVKQRWHVYKERPLRDVGELFSVMRKVVNSDSSRLTSVKELMQKHPKLIVFYNFDYELEILRTLSDHSQNEGGINQTDWDWLLSPEGMRANLENQKSMTAISSAGSTPSSRSSSSKKSPEKFYQNGNALGLSGTGSTRSVVGSSILSPADTRSVSPAPVERSEEWDTESKHASSTSTPTNTRNASSTSPTMSTRSSQTGSGSTTASEVLLQKSMTSDTSSQQRLISSGHTTTTLSGMPQEVDIAGQCLSLQESTDDPGQPNSFSVAEWNGHKHQPIPKTDSWVYLVQYQAGAEGWNCTETDAMCFYSLTYSYKNWHQAHGRIDRLDTPFAKLFYYVLKSDSKIDRWVWKALREKRNFNQKNLGKNIWTD